MSAVAAPVLRDATAADWPLIWPFLQRICAEGETFSYPVDLTQEVGRGYWMLPPPGRTVVAADAGGRVLGTAKMNPNQMGNAGHVASASFMVDPAHAGRGVGRALCTEALRWAAAEGYRGMQFNAVVASNTHAVALYRSLGFEVVGTVPDGFRHPRLGYVGLHIMYKSL
ncbi:GNAT family N-acetyltransferase [Actinacidiphila sp. bgisy145]|uniref:GNAT family N-acetyltransferase n=1 Tax=Actinacidiphila sp. bgisy145 TaxID=3413792 RepID=UPI003EBA68DA